VQTAEAITKYYKAYKVKINQSPSKMKNNYLKVSCFE
jgi:hypothetical protein